MYKRCVSCGKELISTMDNCMECREEVIAPHADLIFPLFSYRLWNKQLMFLWKSEEVRALSLFFASELKLVLKTLGFKIIIPVPPRPGKIQEKGWDQIDELCNILEFRFGFKILRLLERNIREQQKKLDRLERFQIIKKGYALTSSKIIERELKKYKINLPEEVCLIDDVCTTGSTIESCAGILKNIGIKKVYVVTLFKVD